MRLITAPARSSAMANGASHIPPTLVAARAGVAATAVAVGAGAATAVAVGGGATTSAAPAVNATVTSPLFAPVSVTVCGPGSMPYGNTNANTAVPSGPTMREPSATGVD